MMDLLPLCMLLVVLVQLINFKSEEDIEVNFKLFMTRDAKLYLLVDIDWEPLADIIQKNEGYTLENDITVFQLMTLSSKGQQYAILSLNDIVDNVVEKYGAMPASDKDNLRNTLHNYSGDPLFGDKNNLVFLNKL